MEDVSKVKNDHPKMARILGHCGYPRKSPLQMTSQIDFDSYRIGLPRIFKDGVFPVPRFEVDEHGHVSKKQRTEETDRGDRMNNEKKRLFSVHHGKPQPSFKGVITHILAVIFHGFGVQG